MRIIFIFHRSKELFYLHESRAFPLIVNNGITIKLLRLTLVSVDKGADGNNLNLVDPKHRERDEKKLINFQL